MKKGISIIIYINFVDKIANKCLQSFIFRGRDFDHELILLSSRKNQVKLSRSIINRENIKILSIEEKENKADALNKGVGVSSFENILCLEDSFFLIDNRLAEMVKYLKNNSTEAVTFGSVINYFSNQKDVKNVNYFKYADVQIPFDSIFERPEHEAYIDNSSCAMFAPFLIKKEVFMNLGGYDREFDLYQQAFAFKFLEADRKSLVLGKSSLGSVLSARRQLPSCVINREWKNILVSRIGMFNNEIKKDILKFDLNGGGNILNIFRHKSVFADNSNPTGLSVRDNDKIGIARIAKDRLAKYVRSQRSIRNAVLYFGLMKNNFANLIKQASYRKKYYQKIDSIIRKKEIVVKLNFGGLGDCLVYTSLPELLSKKYGIDFYLSESSRKVFRNEDFFKLCFGLNPYFRGFKESDEFFELRTFARDLNLRSFFTDRGGMNITGILESQFRVRGEGLPKIYYKPNLLKEYQNKVLVDKNWHSGRMMGLFVDDSLFDKEVGRFLNQGFKIEYCKPESEDLFLYLDKIFSCHHFISMFSGGNVVAATLKKEATIIMPENFGGGGMTAFIFLNSKNKYLRRSRLVL